MARAMPSWAMAATVLASTEDRAASVAMTPMVVLVPGDLGAWPCRRLGVTSTRRPDFPSRAPATVFPVAGSTTLPTEFTTTKGAHCYAVGQLGAGRADAAVCGAQARSLAHRGAGSCADLAGGHGRFSGRLACPIAHGLVGPDPRVADAQVVDHRGRDDGHDAVSRAEPGIVLFEKTHDAGSCIEAEGAATGQQDAVSLSHPPAGPDGVGLPGAGCESAHVDAGGGAGHAQEHGTAGARPTVGGVTHPNALDRGNRLVRHCSCVTPVRRQTGVPFAFLPLSPCWL